MSACTAACVPSAARPERGTCGDSCSRNRMRVGARITRRCRQRRRWRREDRVGSARAVLTPFLRKAVAPQARGDVHGRQPIIPLSPPSFRRGRRRSRSGGGGYDSRWRMNRISATNDFVVKFANINGSGSASANELFAKCILRMGVPVSPRNIFPSNIQGLPTWYEVRVSEAGWLGRRGGYDLLVAMNPQTWDEDVKGLAAGGYLFYDSSKPLPKFKFRDDVNTIGVPLTDIANQTWDDPRQRQLFKRS